MDNQFALLSKRVWWPYAIVTVGLLGAYFCYRAVFAAHEPVIEIGTGVTLLVGFAVLMEDWLHQR